VILPNLAPAIFVPGKIIQIRSKDDPFRLAKLAFISVEDHIHHVTRMHQWLCPQGTPLQEAGAILHDIGKKVGARWEFLVGLGAGVQALRGDFYGMPIGNVALPPGQSAQRYLEFIRTDRHRMRLWPVLDDSGSVQDVRLDLSAPFGNHAADASEEDLRPFRGAALDLESDQESRDYVLNLVHLHHSFQPNRIIGACARHGERFVADLYHLIVADHMGSRWAEYVVQQLEAGLEMPDRADMFGDVDVSVAVDADQQEAGGEMRAGSIVLRRTRLPGERDDPLDVKLMVRYHVATTNWNLIDELARQTATRPRKANVGARQQSPRKRS
jgi:hypothetical protein